MGKDFSVLFLYFLTPFVCKITKKIRDFVAWVYRVRPSPCTMKTERQNNNTEFCFYNIAAMRVVAWACNPSAGPIASQKQNAAAIAWHQSSWNYIVGPKSSDIFGGQSWHFLILVYNWFSNNLICFSSRFSSKQGDVEWLGCENVWVQMEFLRTSHQ